MATPKKGPDQHVRVTSFVKPEVAEAIKKKAKDDEVSEAAVMRKVLSDWKKERD